MFDKNKFAQVLKNINDTYDSQRDFAKKSEINRTYLSQYMNLKLDDPPKPKILEKLASSSNGITTYAKLMEICGYAEETLEKNIYDIYSSLKDLCCTIYDHNSEKVPYEIEDTINSFENYLSKVCQSIKQKNFFSIQITHYFDKEYFLSDYNFVVAFLFLHDAILMLLEKNNFISIRNYTFNDYRDIDALYNYLQNLEDLELFSYNNKNFSILSSRDELVEYLKKIMTCIKLSYLSDFDDNALTKRFKDKVLENQNDYKNIETSEVDKYGRKVVSIPLIRNG